MNNAQKEQLIRLTFEPPCGDFESAEEFVQWLWADNPVSCGELLADSLREKDIARRLAGEVTLASLKMGSPQFNDLLFSFVKMTGIPSKIRTEFSLVLVSVGHEGALKEFDKSFATICDRFLQGKDHEQSLASAVRRACILRRTHLHTKLEETLRAFDEMESDRPYFFIGERERIETLCRGMKDGEETLKAVFNSEKSNINHKEAAVFGLGCTRDPRLFSFFAKLWEREPFEVRRQCVGAMVYVGDPDDIARFMTEKLAHARTALQRIQRSRWRRRLYAFVSVFRVQCADNWRLLMGATYCPTLTDGLEQELRRWLEVEWESYAAYAYLALERHGIHESEWEKRLAHDLKDERLCRSNMFELDDLLQSRSPWSNRL